MEESSLRVLVVDDERPIRRFLRTALSGKYTILEADNGEEALQAVATNRPDVILLDLGLPDMDGFEVTRRLREWTHVPIIVVSVREREEDKISALDCGADDYLTKPFSVGELMARIRAALRRTIRSENEPTYSNGALTINLLKREVLVNNQPVLLTPTEYEILRTLVQHAGRVMTHRQIIQMVWGENYDADSHLLRVNVSNIRRKIESDPSQPHLVITEPGVGYRLRDLEEPQ